jgi:hypothetical protein
MRQEVSWAELEALGTWEAIFEAMAVQRVIWSRARDEAGYRVEAVGFLPGVLVLPAAWHLRLPPLSEAWVIPSQAEEGITRLEERPS